MVISFKAAIKFFGELVHRNTGIWEASIFGSFDEGKLLFTLHYEIAMVGGEEVDCLESIGILLY